MLRYPSSQAAIDVCSVSLRSVTFVGAYAFARKHPDLMTDSSTIMLPSIILSCVIASDSLCHCIVIDSSNPVSVVLPTSLVEIWGYAFSHTSLTTVTIPT